MPTSEQLDLTSDEGQELLLQNRKAVANDDTISARNSNVLLTEGELSPFTEGKVTQEDSSSFYKEVQPSMEKSAVAESSLTGALVKDSIDPIEDFKVIRDELTLFGESPTYQEIAERLRNEAKFELSGIIEDTAALGKIEDVNTLIKASPDLLLESSSMRNKALDNSSRNQIARDSSVRGESYQAWYQDGFFERSRARESVNKVLDRSIAKASGDTIDALSDMGGTLFVSEQLFLGRAAKDILGETYFALGGEMKRDMADWILAGRTEEEQVARATKVTEEISKAAGIQTLGGNDVVKVFALETIRDYINRPSSERDWARYIDNTVGVVGVIPLVSEALLASTVRRLITASRTATSSGRTVRMLDDVTEADPELSSSLNAAAIRDEDVAANLGMTQEEAIQRTLPHGSFEPDVHLEGAPQQIVDDINFQQTRANEVDDYIDNTFLFSSDTYNASEKKVLDILHSDEVTGIAKPSISSMGRKGNKISMEVVYGANDTNYPIETLEQANALKQLLEDQFKDAFKTNLETKLSATPSVRVIVKDDVTGVYGLPEGTTVRTKPRFYVSIKQDIPMLYSDIVPGPQDVTKPVGRVMRFLMAPNTFLSKNLVGAAVISNEKKAFIANELTAIASPFLRLNHNSKVKVADLLTEGEEAGKVFRYSELDTKYSPGEIKAYYSARQFNETGYRIKNNDMYEQLKGQGVKSINVTMDDAAENIYSNAGVPLEVGSAKKIKVAYDIKQGKEIDLTSGGAARVYEDGKIVVKARTKLQTDTGDFQHIIVRGDDIGEIPRNVMPYRVGYNMRINNDPYFVTSKFKGRLDGEVTEINKVVGVAESSGQAQKWIDELAIQDPSKTYSFRVDRNISSTESLLKQDYDLLDGSGPQFWYSKRGERLQRQDGSLSAVEDPVATIHRLSKSIANVVTHKQMFEAAITNHQKKYGNIQVGKRPVWEYSPGMKEPRYIGKDFSESVHPELKAANREYEYLESLKEMPTTFDQIWQELMLGMDRSFLNKVTGTDKLSKGVVALSGITPGHVTRNVTFALTIPLRPVKQLMLQWTTGFQLVGIDAKATSNAFKDSLLMNYSLAAWDNPARWNRYIKPVAKAFGYKPGEWEEIFKQFRISGKAHSIDSNVMISEANFGWSRSMPSSALGRLGQTARNVAIAPVTIGKRIGFDLGELGNQSVSWLFARERWVKANPGKAWNGSQQSLDQISALARNLSIDMTKTNLLPYQRGAFATMTQFMSINHKMGLRLLGADPDVPALSKTHAKFIGGMATMYGAAGLGLQDFYEEMKLKEGLDIPSELDDVLYGGLTQFMFNKSLDLAFGEDIGTTRIALGDSFSPAAGAITFAPELISEMFEGNFLDALAGPSGSTFTRLGRSADHIMFISGRKDFDTETKLLMAGGAAISEFGAFSDRFNYNLAMSYKEKMDTYNVINRKGMIGAPTNQSELFAKMLFGLGTRSEGEFYNTVLKLQSEVSSGKADSEINDDAKRLAEWWWRNWLANKDSEASFAEAVQPIMNSLNNGGDRLYNQQVWNVARKRLRQKPGFDKFLASIAKNHKILDADADMDEMKNIVSTTSLLSDEEKQRVLRLLDVTEANVNSTRDILENLGDF